MAKLIKRKKPSVSDKFRQGQAKANEQLRVNKESEELTFLNKVLASPIAPIIESFYVDNPVCVSKKLPYYATASFKKGILSIRKAIRGTLFNDNDEFRAYHNRKFSIDEILASISNHKLAMSPEYKPADKKYLKVNLDQFLLNPYAKSIGKSFLIYWMTVDPMPTIKPAVDKHPEITSRLINLFEWGGLTYEDGNNVILGVSMFKEVLSTAKISPIFRLTPVSEAEMLWQILTDVFETVNKPVMPRNLVSPKFKGWIERGLAESDYTI